MTDFSSLNPGPTTASLVVASDGGAVSALGTSAGLGNQTDLQLLKWFRARAAVVLTSGLTAKLENYRMPQKAKLAIFTRSERDYPKLRPHLPEVLWPKGKTYLEAFQQLVEEGFGIIHTEFGPTGFINLVLSGAVDGYLSSLSESGIENFCSINQLEITSLHKHPDLVIARVSGRGKA